MREATVAASWPRSLLDFAVSKGADRETLLRRSSTTAPDLDDPTARIPLIRYVALMDAAIELTGDPALALKYGEQIPMADLSIVPLVATAAETAGDVGTKMNRYSALMLDDGEDRNPVDFFQSGGKLWIKLNSPVYARYPSVTEAGIARSVCGARSMLRSLDGGSPGRFPEEIHFTYPEPAYRAEYDRLFGVPLVFNSDMNGMAVNPAILTMPMPKPFSAAATMVTEKAEELLSKLDRTGSTRAAVEDALMQSFESGDVRMEIIAHRIGLSRASLFRRLKSEGLTFDEVLNALRHRRALQLLNNEKRTVQQTAHMLGFSDPAAFSRAFKRWTGKSPSEARA